MKFCIKFQQVKWVLFTSTWLQQKIFVNKHTTRSWIHRQDFDKHPTFRVTYTSMCRITMPKFPRFSRHSRYLTSSSTMPRRWIRLTCKLALAIRDDCLYSNQQLLQSSKYTFRFTLQCLQLYTSTLVPHRYWRQFDSHWVHWSGLVTWLVREVRLISGRSFLFHFSGSEEKRIRDDATLLICTVWCM